MYLIAKYFIVVKSGWVRTTVCNVNWCMGTVVQTTYITIKLDNDASLFCWHWLYLWYIRARGVKICFKMLFNAYIYITPVLCTMKNSKRNQYKHEWMIWLKIRPFSLQFSGCLTFQTYNITPCDGGMNDYQSIAGNHNFILSKLFWSHRFEEGSGIFSFRFLRQMERVQRT